VLALTSLQGWAGALLVVALVGCGQQLDQRAEWRESQRLAAEQRAEARAERAQRAAQAMCSADFGPQVLAVWVNKTTVVCVNTRGRQLARYSKEL